MKIIKNDPIIKIFKKMLSKILKNYKIVDELSFPLLKYLEFEFNNKICSLSYFNMYYDFNVVFPTFEFYGGFKTTQALEDKIKEILQCK